MKTLLKRILVAMLALAVLCSAVACGGNNETPSNTDSGNQSEESTPVDDDFFGETIESGDSNSGTAGNNNGTSAGGQSLSDVLKKLPATAKGKTITIYNWNAMREYTGAQKVIDSFQKETGITIEWKTVNFDNYLDNLANLVASGKSPDLVRLRNPLPSGLKSIQPISVSGFDFSDSAWDQQLMKAYTYNGNVYGVNLENTHIGSPTIFAYNKALIKKYDLDDPYKLWKNNKWTVDAFIDLCKEYKKESKAESAMTTLDISAYTSLFSEGPISTANGQFKSLTNDTEFRKRVQEACDYLNKDKIFDCGWKTSEFDRGEILFFNTSAILTRRMNAYFSQLKSAGTLGVVPPPTVPGKKESANFGEYEAYGIAKGAKNADIAPYFLRYFLDQSNYDMKSFFCNEQALEVYTHLMSLENRNWSVGYTEHFFYGGQDDGFADEIETVTGAQSATVINKYASIIKTRADNYNKDAKALK